ncbi:MAG: glutathione S-transferase [Rhodoferax sp.]|nr:glutathione S-transferase [Rhodoferax sp.]
MLHIWGRLSSLNVRKVVWTAQELGLDFQRTDAGMAFGIVQTPHYLAMNPNAKVPLLQDGELVLWESNVMVRYLCAKHASGSLYPTDLAQRFNAERWMDWQQTSFNPAGSPGFKQWIRTAPAERNSAVIAQSQAATEPLLALLDAHLSQQPYMAGATFTMADIPLATDVQRWLALPQQRPTYPHVERWLAQITQRPASKGVLDLPLS